MPELCPHCGAALPTIRDGFCPECRNDLAEPPTRPDRQPRPEGRSRTAETARGDVWYADEARVYRWFKLSWYDDRGLIDATAEGVRFSGQRGELRMNGVTAVEVTGPVVPWAAVASMALGNVIVLLLAGAGTFNYLTLQSPATYALLSFLNLFALCSWPMRWVRVTYVDGREEPRRAYFTVSSLAGRWAGGVRSLHNRLQQQLGADHLTRGGG
jgi:hypothetical protein